VAWGGRLLVIGFAAGDIRRFPSTSLSSRSARSSRLLGRIDQARPEGHTRNVKQLVEWLAAGKVNPVISERVPLSEAAAAMKRMFNRQVKGKIVVLPKPDLTRIIFRRILAEGEGEPGGELRTAIHRVGDRRIIGPIVGRFDPLELPGRSPPLLDEFCPDPFPAYGPQ